MNLVELLKKSDLAYATSKKETGWYPKPQPISLMRVVSALPEIIITVLIGRVLGTEQMELLQIL